ncbi:MAG: hypothetical protein R3A52_28180 [Polyangiales bacterium]
MDVSLRRAVALAHKRTLTSADAAASSVGWLFLGAMVALVATDAWRQAHGGVGYLNDYTPCVGVAFALLPALFTRSAALDALAQRLTHALLGVAYASLAVGFFGDYASLARSASDGAPYVRDPSILSQGAVLATPLVWLLVRYAPRVTARALSLAAVVLAPAALVASLVAVAAAFTGAHATSVFRDAPAVTTLPPPSTWPARDGVHRWSDDALPWDIEARCERWYCGVRPVARGASAGPFSLGFAPTLSPSRRVVVRRPARTGVWFLAGDDGRAEVTFATTPRYASLVDLRGRASMPAAWALASLVASVAAVAFARRARGRRASALQHAWERVMVSPEGVVTDAWKDELDVVCDRPPAGSVLARVERVRHEQGYRDAASPRRVVAWVPGDREALVSALDAGVAEADARALALIAWGVAPAVAWALRLGLSGR